MKKLHIKNGQNIKNLIISILTTYIYTKAVIEANNTVATIVFCTITMFFCIGVLLDYFDKWVAGMNKRGKNYDE
jgi:hypothetical protein